MNDGTSATSRPTHSGATMRESASRVSGDAAKPKASPHVRPRAERSHRLGSAMFVGHGDEDWLNPRNLHRVPTLVIASQDDAVRFCGKMRAAEFEPDERPSHGRKTARKRT